MQDEQVIETLASYTSEKAFTCGIRLRNVIRCFENLDSTCLRNPLEALPKLTIIIPDEILRPLTIGSGFPKLLCSPGISRISCDADVDHSARLQFDDEEGEQRAEEEGSHWEKVAGPDLLSMSVYEGAPLLSSWPCGAHGSHVLLDRALADVNTQLE